MNLKPYTPHTFRTIGKLPFSYMITFRIIARRILQIIPDSAIVLRFFIIVIIVYFSGKNKQDIFMFSSLFAISSNSGTGIELLIFEVIELLLSTFIVCLD